MMLLFHHNSEIKIGIYFCPEMCLIQARNDTDDLEDRVAILEILVENLEDQIAILENEDSILDKRISDMEDDVTSNQNSIAGKAKSVPLSALHWFESGTRVNSA